MSSELHRPSSVVRAELEEILATYGGRVSETFVALRDTGSSDPLVLANASGAGSRTAIYNYLRVIDAVLDAQLPPSPSIRGKAAAWTRRLRGQMATTLTDEAMAYLDNLVVSLELAAANQEDVAQEEREETVRSEVVANRITSGSGVYVYTYKHYRRYPYLLLPDASGAETTELHLMKVGYTDRGSDRVFQQESSAPEPIQWLRFYEAPDGRTAAELEDQFHSMLDRAGHPRAHPPGRGRAREWFATDVLFLDELAASWNLRGVGETPLV